MQCQLLGYVCKKSMQHAPGARSTGLWSRLNDATALLMGVACVHSHSLQHAARLAIAAMPFPFIAAAAADTPVCAA